MLEYIFFDAELREKFSAFMRDHGQEATLSEEGGLIAAIAEDLDDELQKKIDDYYDVLLQENADKLEETEDALVINAAGVQVQLADGSSCTIRLAPDLLGRLLKCLSAEEIRDLAQTIAEGVERHDNRPLCRT